MSCATSRVTTTRLLAETIAAADGHPAFLAGNAIAWYGDHGDEPVTEESDSRGDALLTRVTREWQQAAEPAVDCRVTGLRAADLAGDGTGARPRCKQLRLLFKAGLGARLGNGEQWMPMISLRDWLGAVTHLAEHPDAAGPFNLVLPRDARPTPSSRRRWDVRVHRPTLAGGSRGA